jgi:predicted membrane protein
LYKFIFSIILAAWIIAKLIFSDTLRERFKLFFPIALLFMLLETEIADWAKLPDENIINNWFVLLAAVIADSAFNLLIPKRTKKEHSNRFSNATHYFDVSKTTKSNVYNRMGNTEVYYQNAELADPAVELELTVSNKMGNVSIYVPTDWIVEDEISNHMGNVEIRENTGCGIRLILKGENKMGNIEVI